MDIASILLILAVALLVTAFVSRPFLVAGDGRTRAGIHAAEVKEHQRSALMAERDRILNALQELDFDATLGKIPEGEYPQMRAAMLQHGAEVLRQLDALQEEVHAHSVEERVEAAVAARRADAAHSAAPVAVEASTLADDDLERQIAARRSRRQENAGGFCPDCGLPVQKSDRFCPRCGKSL